MLSEKLMYWLSKPIVGTYTQTLLQMNVKKHDEMPDGPKIIAANHPSTTDPFFVAAMVKKQSFILINNLLFQVPILGRYLRYSGHIPVKVGSGQQAVDRAIEYLKDGHTVMIFPEGDLSPSDGGFHQARTGVARLALESGAPVIPVGIHLLWEKVHSITSIVKGKAEIGRWYIEGPYHITVGHQMVFNGKSADRTLVRSVADRIMRQIVDLTYESRNRLNRQRGIVPGIFNPLG